MKVNEKKLKRQLGIVDKWVRNTGARGTLEAATGFGKTYTALLAIERFQKKYPNEQINIVVPTTDLFNQWNKELEKRKLTLNTSVIKVWVINTYIRYTHKSTLLILDECHRYASEEFSKVFEYTEYNFILGLTATLERNDGLHSLIEELAPIFDTVSLAEAQAEGYVSNFKTFNLAIEFNSDDWEKYNKIDSTFKNAFAYFHRDFEVAMNCRKGNRVMIRVGEGEYITASEYRLRFARNNGWSDEDVDNAEHHYHPTNVMKKAQQWGASMHSRKTILHTAEAKIDVIKKIIEAFPNKKTIIFSENSEFADKVTEKLGDKCRSYHSKVKGEQRTERIEKVNNKGEVLVTYKEKKWSKDKILKETLELFKKGEISILSTVRKLDEGFDDEEIELAIMASYSSSKRQDTQRTGEALPLPT